MNYLNISIKEGIVFLKVMWINGNNFGSGFRKFRFFQLLILNKLLNKSLFVMKVVYSSFFYFIVYESKQKSKYFWKFFKVLEENIL